MMLGRRERCTLLSAAALPVVIMCAPVIASNVGTGGDKSKHAFLITNLFLVSSGDANTCPVMSPSALDAFARSLPKTERAQYATPEKLPALARLAAERLGYRSVWIGDGRGPDRKAKLPEGFDTSAPMTLARALAVAGANGFPARRGYPTWSGSQIDYDSCTNPEDFPQLADGYRIYTGKVAPGSDLDGKNGTDGFTGTDGTSGVDNQLWRAVGCQRGFRDEGDVKAGHETMLSSQAPTAIVVSQVDDLHNDPDVKVDIYAVREPIARDGRSKALAGATFTPVADPSLGSSVRGRIVDGVLTTDPVDIKTQYKEQILDTQRHFRGARIKMAFKPGGAVEGSINGYYTLASFWEYMMQRTQVSADVTGYSCPGVRRAIDRLADGYRDPKTKRFTAISSSFEFVGVHAFINDDPTARSAVLETAR